jgi:branched-chain amino acid transport system ATP-binding protein
MLKINNLHVYYGGIHAVKGITLDIPRGQIVTLIGANGAGKSSTVRAVAGLIKNAKGEILLSPRSGGENEKPLSLLGKTPELIVRSGVALSPEGRRILPHLTVEENLRLGAYVREDTEAVNKDREWVYSLFPRLKERSWQKGGTLSGGEQQMLAVGRALMSNPDLLMLDEPSLGLAPLLVRDIFGIIKYINSLGKTVLLIEQHAFAALSIAHYAYILETGSVVLQGEGKELLHNPQVKEAYLGG